MQFFGFFLTEKIPKIPDFSFEKKKIYKNFFNQLKSNIIVLLLKNPTF